MPLVGPDLELLMSAGMSIEGSLSDYEILDVITILVNRAETGRLYIDFESTEGFLYFDKGNLVAAHVGAFAGVSAVNLAISMEGNFFRFEPGGQTPTRQFRDRSEKHMLKELLGIETMPAQATTAEQLTTGRLSGLESRAPAIEDSASSIPEKDKTRSPDNFASAFELRNRAGFSKRQAVTVGTASILSIGLLAAAGAAAHWGAGKKSVTQPLSSKAVNAAVALEQVSTPKSLSGSENKTGRTVTPSTSITPSNTAATASDNKFTSRRQSTKIPAPGGDERDEARIVSAGQDTERFKEISVVVKIKGGRVLESYVKNRHPNEAAFEATALQLARQRRFSTNKDGIETLVFRIAKEK